MAKNFEVSRQFAAEILNVSTRTLDRYLKKDKITSMRRGRQLFFDEQELLEFKAKLMAKEQLEQKTKARQKAKIKPRARAGEEVNEFPEVTQAQVFEQTAGEGSYEDEMDWEFAKIRDSMLRQSPEESIYKNLFEKAEGEIKELQTSLDRAHYRVGELEAQVKTMVPVLEYKKQKEELLLLAEENRFKQEDIKQLERDLRVEAFAKKIYAGFLYAFVAAIPLLVLLRLVA